MANEPVDQRGQPQKEYKGRVPRHVKEVATDQQTGLARSPRHPAVMNDQRDDQKEDEGVGVEDHNVPWPVLSDLIRDVAIIESGGGTSGVATGYCVSTSKGLVTLLRTSTRRRQHENHRVKRHHWNTIA